MRGRHSYLVITSCTLAVACGAFVLVFALGRSLFAWSTPIERPERVVAVLHGNTTRGGGDRSYFGLAGLEQLRETGLFESVSGHILTDGTGADFRTQLLIERVARHVETVAVHHEYFSVLRVPVRGRWFREEDDLAGSDPVAIISDRLWRNAFAADDSVLGTVVQATPLSVRIVGIAPPGFQGARLGEATDIWLPSGLMPRLAMPGRAQGDILYQAVGRLREDVAVEQATRSLMELYDGERPLMAVPLTRLFGSAENQTVVVESDRLLRFLPIVGGLVLLAGFATLASLATVHYQARRRELAIRSALGASLARVASMLIRETAGVVLLGTLGAIAVVWLGLGLIPAVTLPTGVDLGRLNIGLDGTLVAVAGGVSVAGLSLALLGPLVRAVRPQLAREALVGGRCSSAASHAVELGALSVQSAASVALIVLAFLLAQTVSYAENDSVGFDLDRLVFVQARVQRETERRFEAGHMVSEVANLESRQTRLSGLLVELSTLPGVETVALGFAPLGPQQVAWANRVTTDNASEEASRYLFGSVGGTYFDALGLPLVAGQWSDRSEGPENGGAAVTESMARALWPGESPLGKVLGDDTVVAVVKDFTIGLPSSGTRQALFRHTDPREAARSTYILFIVRSRGSGERLVPHIDASTRRAFPEASTIAVEPATTVVAADIGRQRLGAWFVTLFGLAVVVLSAFSIVGVIDRYSVSRRRELAIRLAMGAQRREVARLVAKQALVPVVGGTLLGLAVGAIGARFFASLLLGVGPLEPGGYLLAAAVTLVVSLLGTARAVQLVRGVNLAPSLGSE